MLQYFDEMKEVIRNYGLEPGEVIIVGSGAVTVKGGRKNNDIEFCVSKKAYHKIPLRIRLRLIFVDHEDLGGNVDLFRNRYLCMGIKDEILFQNKWFYEYKGCGMARPELEYLYKMHKRRDKDLADMEQIKHDDRCKKAFDWDFIEAMEKERIPAVYTWYSRFRDVSWRCMKKLERGMGRLRGRKS